MNAMERTAVEKGSDMRSNKNSKKDIIVQFVCYETITGFDEFVIEWDRYAKGYSI